MHIPKIEQRYYNELLNAINDGVNNGLNWDLIRLSKICGREIQSCELEGIDEDSVSPEIIEQLYYGRPPKFEKVSREEFMIVMNDILDNKYSEGRQNWIFEMFEIMFSLPTGFISQKMYFDNVKTDILWLEIQGYRPIIL